MPDEKTPEVVEDETELLDEEPSDLPPEPELEEETEEDETSEAFSGMHYEVGAKCGRLGGAGNHRGGLGNA